MLKQLDVRPGHRVLEIGAGTGYNSALLTRLVGAAGEVTTVDIDAEVVRGARECLGAAGHPGVSVICGDGEFGCADQAPYDRIMVTGGRGTCHLPGRISSLSGDGCGSHCACGV